MKIKICIALSLLLVYGCDGVGEKSTSDTVDESEKANKTYTSKKKRRKRRSSTQSRQQSSAAASFSEPAVSPPADGSVRRWVRNEPEAPLEIRTEGSSNYLVKVVTADTDQPIADVYVKGGSTIEILVPTGTYRLKYAVGTTWYGYTHRFGPATGYYAAESLFRFSNDGYQISGYTVTLYTVAHGNLSTSEIDPSQF